MQTQGGVRPECDWAALQPRTTASWQGPRVRSQWQLRGHACQRGALLPVVAPVLPPEGALARGHRRPFGRFRLRMLR